jgi:profilin
MVSNSPDRSLLFSSPSHFQGDGAVLVKTKQAILVAEYAAPIQAPEATPVVENLADYLINLEY